MQTYQKLLLCNLHLFPALILFFLSASSIQLLSQDETIFDSLVTGQKYRITLYSEKELIGEVVKQDSVYAYVVGESGTSRIKKDDIFSVSKNAVPKIIKAMFSIGGGVIIPGNVDHGYNALEKAGFSFQFSALKPLDENKALRLDISYSRISSEEMYFSYYPYNSITSSSGDLQTDLYHINGNFVFGNYSTDSKFNLYGLFGIGMFILRQSDFTFTYYSNYDSTYHTNTEIGTKNAYLDLTVGGGLRFNLKNRVGAYAEIQYNMFTNGGFFLFFGRGYFPIRAGLTYTFY